MQETVPHQLITHSGELAQFCRRASQSPYLAFDTEFISENRYRPKLCLLQVATESEYVLIDTMAIDSVIPFWELLVQGDHTTIVHAAREEFLFCFRATGQRPKKLFDIQMAAAMVGFEYPAAYSNLVGKILGVSLQKGETRTDWRKRPLSSAQTEYALQDIVHLIPIYHELSKRLERQQRSDWLTEEMESWLDSLQEFEIEPQWHRVPGISNLSGRALATVRELWIFRDAEASLRDRSPRRILPDDLLVELARRGTEDRKKLKAIRGFEHRVSENLIAGLSAAIKRANALPSDQLPTRFNRGKGINLGLLGQFLNTALRIICDQESIAAGLVGTSHDLQELAAWHLQLVEKEPLPLMASGWRAEIIGKTIEEILDGKLAIQVGNAQSDSRLKILPVK